MNGHKIAIVMPVYNEVDSIKDVIMELFDVIVKRMDGVDIWVFEDGSTDGTKEVLAELSEELPNLIVQMESTRKGYPCAMREAILAIDPKVYPYILTLDSDGQYYPQDFFRLWEIMRKEAVDIVIGKRVRRAEPFYRKFLSWGLRTLEKRIFSVQCSDVTSVMRLMKTGVARRIASMVKYSKYNFWLEFTAWMSLLKYKIVEVPIGYRERKGESKVYSVRKMPKIISSEFKALYEVWKYQKRRHVNEEWVQSPDLK